MLVERRSLLSLLGVGLLLASSLPALAHPNHLVLKENTLVVHNNTHYPLKLDTGGAQYDPFDPHDILPAELLPWTNYQFSLNYEMDPVNTLFLEHKVTGCALTYAFNFQTSPKHSDFRNWVLSPDAAFSWSFSHGGRDLELWLCSAVQFNRHGHTCKF